MKRNILLTLILGGFITCSEQEELYRPNEEQIRFSVAVPPQNETHINDSLNQPYSAIVTFIDQSGEAVLDREELRVYYNGSNEFISAPLTINTNSSTNHYRLTEFLLLDEERIVTHLSPINHSDQPIDVYLPQDVIIETGRTTTISPEVIVFDKTAEYFGYEPLDSIIGRPFIMAVKCYIEDPYNFEMTNAKVLIEGLEGNNAVWAYEKDLEAEVNLVKIKRCASYKITVTKEGYTEWSNIVPIKTGDSPESIEAILHKSEELAESLDKIYFQTPHHEEATDVISTPDGGYLMVGMSEGAFKKLLVVKTNSNGDVEWSWTHDNASAYAVATTPEGDYIVVGDLYTRNASDAFVIKLSSQGHLIWKRNYGETEHNHGFSVAVANDGHIIVGGSRLSQNPTMGPENFWVLKLSPNGHLVWDKLYGTPFVHRKITRLRITSDGGYLLAGDSRNEFNTGLIVRLNAAGETMWKKDVPMSINDIDLLLDNTLILAGAKYSRGNTEYDDCITKIDAQGQLIWEKIYPSSHMNRNPHNKLNTVSLLPDGRIIAGGDVAGVKGFSGKTAVKIIDASGQLKKEVFLSGMCMNKLTIGNNNELMVAGSLNDQSSILNDFWAAKLEDFLY